MKKIFIVLTVLASLVGCNNTDTTKTTSKEQATEQRIDTNQNNSERQILIAELKKLQQIIASSDKEKIAEIFSFPLSDTAFSIFIDDSSYNEQFITNGNKTTKAMFLRHFIEISESVWLDQMDKLFDHLNIDSLLYKDHLVANYYIKTEPCYNSYNIDVSNSRIEFRIDGKSNQKFKSKKSFEDGIPENSSEFCEHSLWWIFRFDGMKLYLENISVAG